MMSNIQALPDLSQYFTEIIADGTCHIVRMRFPNNYGLSIAKSEFHRCGEGTYEVAILQYFSDKDFDLVYDTGLADDVIGWQTPDDIRALAYKVMEL